MAKRINFANINRAALAWVEGLMAEWLPGGRFVTTKDGRQWVAKNPVRDEKHASFSVSLVSGAFNDYADPGVRGGDLVALYSYLYSVDMRAAATQLAQRFNVPLYEDDSFVPSGEPTPVRPAPMPSAKPDKPESEKRSPWQPVVPAPAYAGPVPLAHVLRGKPERTWCYRDQAGAVVGYVFRFQTSDGGKEVLPLVWAKHGVTGKEEWRWMQWPIPRPLYGLDRLGKAPADATVLVVEGEKCADVAQTVLPDLVAMSWPGGCKADGKADWQPLAGRRVVIWPDCDSKRVPLSRQEKEAGVAEDSKPLRAAEDQPGMSAALRIAQRLNDQGCEVWMLDIPPPGGKPDGWDIADAVDEGMDAAALLAFIQDKAQRFAPAGEGEEGHAEADKPASTPSQAGAGKRYQRDESWRNNLLYGGEKLDLIDCRENVYLMLMHHPALKGLVASDTFARKIVKTRVPPWGGEAGEWQEHDSLRLGLWLAQAEYLRIRSTENLEAAVAWCANENGFHPVREYLDSLQWDGIERLNDWLGDYLGMRKTEYVVMSGRMALIGMVARIYEPGCILRMMPILEGEQFKGKSTVLRILGGKWFSDTPLDLNNKDTYQLIQGIWVYEIAELDSFNRAESTRMKAFISSPSDRFRAPYERAPKDHLRSVMFWATTNQDEYFKDQTGNTRYWPWRTMQDGPIELEKLRGIRDQLLAEAVVRYRRGERWYPTAEEQTAHFTFEQTLREIGDPWEQIIASWLRRQTSQRITQTDILFDCLKIEPGKIDGARSMSIRIGNVMKRLEWVKQRESKGGMREFFYVPPKGWMSKSHDRQEGEDHAAY